MAFGTQVSQGETEISDSHVTHLLTPMALSVATDQALWCEWVLDASQLVCIICRGHHQSPISITDNMCICGKACGYCTVQQSQQYCWRSGHQHALLLDSTVEMWAGAFNLAGRTQSRQQEGKFMNSLSSPLVHPETFVAANIHWIYYWSHFILSGGSAVVFNFWFLFGEEVRLAIIIMPPFFSWVFWFHKLTPDVNVELDWLFRLG